MEDNPTIKEPALETHLNVGNYLNEIPPHLNDRDIFGMAKSIIYGSGILFCLSLIAFMIHPNSGSEVIELCRTVIMPLLTLIIGFYFKS